MLAQPLVLHRQKAARNGYSEVSGELASNADFVAALQSALLKRSYELLQGQKSFEVRWHPFFLNPDAPKEGVNKMEMYNQKFGEQRVQQMVPMMTVCCSLHHMQRPDVPVFVSS